MKRQLTKLIPGFALSMAGCAIPGPAATRAEMLGIESSIYTVTLAEGDATVRYLRGGDPLGQRVIYIHGTPGDAMNAADMLLDPPPGVEILSIDRPGFGKSEPRREVTALADHARALEPLLVTREGRGTILIGHSYGGPVAAKAAVEYPDRVGGLVLTAAALDPDLERVLFIQRVGEFALVPAVLPSWLRNTNRELIALEAELRELAPRLAEVRAPVEIVHGTRDTLVPHANVPFMVDAFANAPSIGVDSIEGGDHFLPWNSRDRIYAAIERLRAAPAEAPPEPASEPTPGPVPEPSAEQAD